MGFYLTMDPVETCGSAYFLSWQFMGFLTAYFYLFLPLLAAYWLFNKNLYALKYLQFLTAGYRNADNWARCWECFTMVRKALYVGLSTGFLAFRDSRSQLLVTTVLLAVSLGTQLATAPFLTLELNLLESAALLSEFTFAFSIMPRQTGGMGERVVTSSGVGLSGDTYHVGEGEASAAVDALCLIFNTAGA